MREERDTKGDDCLGVGVMVLRQRQGWGPLPGSLTLVRLARNSRHWSSRCPGRIFQPARASAVIPSFTLPPHPSPLLPPTPPQSPAFQSHCGSFSLILHETEPSGKASLLWARGQAAFARQVGGRNRWPVNPCLGFQRPQPQALWASFFPRDSISAKGGLKWQEGGDRGFPALADTD